MGEKVNWNYVAQALNGPSLSAAGSIAVDAYDKFEVTVPDNATQAVNLVPAGTVALLVINPASSDKKLTYKIGANDVPLDGPHVLIGAGAVSLLGGATSLSFTNNTGTDAVIDILVGRDATP
jgi:hypothetical protein